MSLEVLLSPNTIPSIYLTFALSILLVIVDALTKNKSKLQMIVALIGLCFIVSQSIFSICSGNTTEVTLILGDFAKEMLNFNHLTSYFDILFALAGILTILISKDYLSKVYKNYKEHYSLLMFAVFGMMCIAHSNNLIVLFLGIETMSVTFYAMTGFIRTRETSVEGALKYFLLGAFASGFLLYGMTMIYGATGSMNYVTIHNSIAELTATPLYLKLGVGLLLIGLLFKAAAFPFHQWAPDVYQAAGTTTAGFMSTAGKIAALSGFIGIFTTIMPNNSPYTQDSIAIIAVIAALTMIIGNVTALKQTNIKRILAYSSVGHAGYMLMGIISNSTGGTNAILFYSLAYIFTQIGAFTIISIIETKEETQLTLNEYAGISKKQPFLAATMAIFLFSLAGIPPFAGFFGKYFLFKATIEAGFTWLTIIAVITSIIACYFYLSIIVSMYFKTENENINTENENINTENENININSTNINSNSMNNNLLSKTAILISAIGIVIFSFIPFIDFIK